MKSQPAKYVLGLPSILFLVLLLAAPIQGGAASGPVGRAFELDPPTELRHRAPVVAMIPGGELIAVWEDPIDGLSGRRLSWFGDAAGGEVGLVANDPIPGLPFNGELRSRKEAAVAGEPNGDFWLFWTEEHTQASIDIFSESRVVLDREVFGRRFDRDGAPLSDVFRVHDSAPGLQSRPQAVRFRDGRVLVVWQSVDTGIGSEDGIFARLFARTGDPTGPAFKIEGSNMSSRRPVVAGNSQGGFLVVWENCCDEVDSLGVFAYSSSLEDPTTGVSGWVNEGTLGNQRVPVVAARRDGGYWVVWQSPTDETGELIRVYARVVSPGLGLGVENPELEASSGPGWAHSSPALARGAGNRALIAWFVWQGDFRTGISAVGLDGDSVDGEAFALSEEPPNAQFRMALSGSRGAYIAAWEGFDGAGPRLVGRLVSPRDLDRDRLCSDGILFNQKFRFIVGFCGTE